VFGFVCTATQRDRQFVLNFLPVISILLSEHCTVIATVDGPARTIRSSHDGHESSAHRQRVREAYWGRECREM